MLLHLVGPDIADISESLPDETEDGQVDEFVRLKGKLTLYLVPVRNVVAERGKFEKMTMEADENLEGFLGRLRTQVMHCGYTTAEIDQQLRDRCVLGSSGELQRRLVREAALKGTDLTLQDIRKTARAHQDVLDLTAQLGECQRRQRWPRTQFRRCGCRSDRRPAGRLGTQAPVSGAGRPDIGSATVQRPEPCRVHATATVRATATVQLAKRSAAGAWERPAHERRVRLVAAEEEQTDGDGDAWLVNTVEASAAEPEMKTVTVNGQ
ncbi:hypothetical protein FJT64_004326 [Amphibalanus amphitrite]|uniref:Uncharacterized protein n=1 Tax=Amphibalanus amphitrite TaxID=1232801 RepID=A0A6A4W3F2_AMPAM|nr:hypothetical protein FJT64_004326 [Amphibalanus amphitrite]